MASILYPKCPNGAITTQGHRHSHPSSCHPRMSHPQQHASTVTWEERTASQPVPQPAQISLERGPSGHAISLRNSNSMYIGLVCCLAK